MLESLLRHHHHYYKLQMKTPCLTRSSGASLFHNGIRQQATLTWVCQDLLGCCDVYELLLCHCLVFPIKLIWMPLTSKFPVSLNDLFLVGWSGGTNTAWRRARVERWMHLLFVPYCISGPKHLHIEKLYHVINAQESIPNQFPDVVKWISTLSHYSQFCRWSGHVT